MITTFLTRHRTAALITAALTFSVVGCGSSRPAGQSIDGFAPGIVEETISLPYFTDQWSPEMFDDSEGFDNQVRFYAHILQTCRILYNNYEAWLNTGDFPPIGEEPPWRDGDESFYDIAQAAIERDDMDALREQMAAPEGCGVWVPSTPGSDRTLDEVFPLA